MRTTIGLISPGLGEINSYEELIIRVLSAEASIKVQLIL